MPVGKSSIRRAAGAIEKEQPKKVKQAFSVQRVLTEIAVADLSVPEGKAVAADAALVKSVKKYGVLNPVFAVRKGETLQLADGFARYAAAKENGLTVIPAIVCEFSGTGAETAAKDAAARRAEKVAPTVREEIAVTDDIHEEKFKAIESVGLGKKMPAYLL